VVLWDAPDRERLRQRIAQRPNAVRFEELARLLEAYGWSLVRVRGSHHLFARGGERLTVPHRRPTVLPVYVRMALAATAGDAEEEDDGPNDGD
jgi:predicted RNA binding protein YcfA (HicA-like mRNA interferase family)